MTAVAKIIVGVPKAGDLGASDESQDSIMVPSLADLPQGAAQAQGELLWIVHADAHPAAGALETLIAAGVRPAVSVAVDSDGVAIERLVGRFADAGDENLLAAVSRRQVPLRHTQLASMVVDRSLVLELAPPDPDTFGVFAATEWTARLFAKQPGVLVTASRVAMSPPVKPALSTALRMSRTGVWKRGETLRELYWAIRG